MYPYVLLVCRHSALGVRFGIERFNTFYSSIYQWAIAFNICTRLLRNSGIRQGKGEKIVDLLWGKVRNTGFLRGMSKKVWNSSDGKSENYMEFLRV